MPGVDGTMYCRWHGFALTQSGDQTWSPYRAYDDGVLIWVGLPTDGEVATDRPSLPPRPPLLESVSAVIAKPGICAPEDVIANRLDRGTAPGSTPTPSVTWSSTTMPAMIRCWWWT